MNIIRTHMYMDGMKCGPEFYPCGCGKLAHKLQRAFRRVAIFFSINSTGTSEETHIKAWVWALRNVD